MRHHADPTTMTRRRLLTGLGVGGALLGAGTPAASARPARPWGAPDGGGQLTNAAPPLTSIASPPEPGVVYVGRSMDDFRPFTGGRIFGGYGVAGDQSDLRATFELPPGALLRDLEVYLHNTVTATGVLAAAVPGSGYLFTLQALSFGAGPAGVRRHVRLVPNHVTGPYPHGSTIVVVIDTKPDATVQINGARLGFTVGAGRQMILPNPVRVYDSRQTGGAVAPGKTRTIPLGSAVPAGATAALVSLSITDTHGVGTLRLGRAGITPTATAIQWDGAGQKVTTSATSRVNANREIAVVSASSSGPTHVVVDVIGYVG
jgi:hypothetical protein